MFVTYYLCSFNELKVKKLKFVSDRTQKSKIDEKNKSFLSKSARLKFVKHALKI